MLIQAAAAIALMLAQEAGGASAGGRCAECHLREAEAHSHTAHSRALGPVLGSLFAQRLPDLPIGEKRGGYLLEYERRSKGLLVTAQRDGDTAQGQIEWVIGAGKQGQTPLVHAGSRFYEHRISFYERNGRFDLTLGHPAGVSQNARAALGRELTNGEVRQCLSCHSTVVSQDLRPLVPGVQCERCHPGADQHAQGHGAPLNPGKLDAAAQVRFCGSCHRSQPPGGDQNDAFNVRFQPLRLIMSACYRSGKLECTTCHGAHVDARRNDPEFYNAKCMQCHSSPHQTGNCIECHMPRENPHNLLAFTDHYIR